MDDLAQVTVYALYLWLAASLLWMWRSVLRNRRARKLAAEQPESELQAGETLADQDEMMSTITTTDPTTSTSADGSNRDLRSGSVPTVSSDPASTKTAGTTAGSLEKANDKLAMAPAASEPKSEARLGSLPAGPEKSADSTQEPPKDSSDKNDSEQPQSSKPQSSKPQSSKPQSSKPETVATAPKLNQPSTIADYLGGIRLPYDLLPMVPNGEKASDQRVSLVSDGAQPEVVGAAIADELERLGYSIKTLSTDEAVAVRAGQTLGLQIYPDAPELSNEAGSRFPEAVAGSVAIDLWIKA